MTSLPSETEKKAVEASTNLVRIMVMLGVLDVLFIAFAIASFSTGLLPEEIGIALVLLSFFGMTGIIVLFALHTFRLTTQFWKEIAAERGYTYVWKTYFNTEALTFREGHSKSTGHGLLGTLEDHTFRFFQYSYQLGSGKSTQYRSYSVFEITFAGTFPHLYFNNVRNHNLSGMKEFFLPQIPLPGAFDNRCKLYGPKGYEMEALEIFTPDVLITLLDEAWAHDIELVDSKLYIFREKDIRTKIQLEEELTRIASLVKLLSTKLDRFKLTPIGDLTHTL